MPIRPKKATTNTDDDIAARLDIVEGQMASFESDLSEIKQLLRSIDTSVGLHKESTRNDNIPHEHQEHMQDGEDTAMASHVGPYSSLDKNDVLKHR